MTHYFVSYNYQNPDKSYGFGSIEMGITDELFMPSEIREYIKDRIKARDVVIINWKEIDANQLCESLSKVVEKE